LDPGVKYRVSEAVVRPGVFEVGFQVIWKENWAPEATGPDGRDEFDAVNCGSEMTIYLTFVMAVKAVQVAVWVELDPIGT